MADLLANIAMNSKNAKILTDESRGNDQVLLSQVAALLDNDIESERRESPAPLSAALLYDGEVDPEAQRVLRRPAHGNPRAGARHHRAHAAQRPGDVRVPARSHRGRRHRGARHEARVRRDGWVVLANVPAALGRSAEEEHRDEEMLIVLKDETWWQDTTTLWNQGSDTGVFPEQKFLTKLLYITQLAIWIYTAFSCKFLEEIRKDYFVMMSHHVVTIALVTWSYVVGFLPVGVIVLLLHDLSDVPLDMLKMANYLKLEGLRGLFVSELMFVVLLVDWSYFRIYLYPTKLLYTAMIENREASMTMEDAHDFTNLFPYPGPPSWLLFNVLLSTLYCLHIWWGFLIVRLAVGAITKGTHETGKDEYEGTSSDSDAENTKED
ncbi:Longevity-assurance protein, partial [Globisporangium splendens]